MMTVDAACRRYLQIRELEDAVVRAEASIEDVVNEIADAEERLSELRKAKSALLKTIREAARDEGQLPLFDVAACLSVLPAGHEREAVR